MSPILRLICVGLGAALLGFLAGRSGEADPVPVGTGGGKIADGPKLRDSRDREAGERTESAGRPGATRALRVRDLIAGLEIDYLELDLVQQDLASEILTARRDELPGIFESIVTGDDYQFEAFELLVRRWAQFDPDEILGLIDKHSSLIHWPGVNGDWFRALACLEMAAVSPGRAAELYEALMESSPPISGTGMIPSTPEDLIHNIYSAIGLHHPHLVLSLAEKSTEREDATIGALIGMVQAGKGDIAARYADSQSVNQAWYREVVLGAWLQSDPGEAARWFRSLDADSRSEVDDDFEATFRHATSPGVSP